jgi:hypothetical protein
MSQHGAAKRKNLDAANADPVDALFDEISGLPEDDDVFAPSEDEDSLSGEDHFPDEAAFEQAAVREVSFLFVRSRLSLDLTCTT